MFRGRRIAIILLTVLTFGSFFSFVEADEQNQVILVLINRLSFTDQAIYSDLAGFAELNRLAAKGALNINSGGSRNDLNSYLSIGGGARANGFTDLGKALHPTEIYDEKRGSTAQEVYYQATGKNITEGDAILLLAFEKFKQANIQKYSYKPAILAETLKEYHLTIKVYGNNDTTEKMRLAPLISTDINGLSYGDIGERTNIADARRPYGIKTNYEYLLQQLETNSATSLIVFDLGDLYRLEAYRSVMNIEYEKQLRKEVYAELSDFLLTLMEKITSQQTLLVVSPMVSSAASKEGSLLAPIWLYNKDQTGNLLISNTTKREGIVANIDIPATIFAALAIREMPQGLTGQPMKVTQSDHDFKQELERITNIYNLRPTVLYPYVMWQVLVLIISIGIWISFKPKRAVWGQLGLAGLLIMPFLMLIAGYLSPTNGLSFIFFIITLSLLIPWLLKGLSPVKLLFLLSLPTFLALTLDIFNGAELIKRSFLGYDPIIGARYYGIGNEYMGIYIGSGFLFTSALLQMKINHLTIAASVAVYGLMSVVLLYPSLGTNAGGAIAAIIAASVAIFKIFRLKWNKKGVGAVFAILVSGLGALLIANYFVAEDSQSHIGRAASQLFNGEISSIFQTIQRKVTMNWRLLKISTWSRIMITSILVLGFLFLKPRNNIRRLKQQYPQMFWGFYGILTGSAVSLLVNDSGVVAASTMIIYFAVPVLYLAILAQKERKL